jgi:hypothetical protein
MELHVPLSFRNVLLRCIRKPAGINSAASGEKGQPNGELFSDDIKIHRMDLNHTTSFLLLARQPAIKIGNKMAF